MEKEFVYTKMEHISKETSQMENSMIIVLSLYFQMGQNIEEMFKNHNFRDKEGLNKEKIIQNMYMMAPGKTVNLTGMGKKHLEIIASMKVSLLMEWSTALTRRNQYNKRKSTLNITKNYQSNQPISQQPKKSIKGNSKMVSCMDLDNTTKLRIRWVIAENSNAERKKVLDNFIQTMVFWVEFFKTM